MSYRVNANSTFQQKVTVMAPNENGTMTKGEFEVTFKRLPQENVDMMSEEQWLNSDVADEVVESVSGIADAQGNELTGDDALKALMSDTIAVAAVVRKYYEIMLGMGPKGRTSRKRRGTG